ncbi:MAG: hypothetical protein RSC29_01010, partial [Oscillospiraceae bacterium]
TWNTAVMEVYEPHAMECLSLKGYSANISDPRDVELAIKSGVKMARGSMEWNDVERVKGVYDFTEFDKIINPLLENGIEPVILLCYNNPLYNGETEIMGRQYGMKNKIEIDAFSKYAAAVANHYPSVRYFEVYNEPNIGFWRPQPNVRDYSYSCMIAEREIKKVNKNAIVLGGAVASGDAKFIENMYNNNVYSYLDGVSYHPYIYFDGSNVDDGYESMAKNIHKKSSEMGGFKEQAITEVGWPTHKNGGAASSTEDEQASELMKEYVVSDSNDVNVNAVYNFINSGTNPDYNEDNFGVVNADRSPKKAYVANATLMKNTAGAQFIGEVNVKENTKAYVYVKDNEPLMILWHSYPKNSSDINDTVSFSGENVKVCDIYNNIISQNTNVVNLKNDPVYVFGLSKKWLNKALSKEVQDILNEELLAIGENSKASYFNDIISMAKSMDIKNELLSDSQALAEITRVYNVGKAFTENYKSLNVTTQKLSALLNVVHKIGIVWGRYYSAVVSPNEVVNIDADRAVENTDLLITQKENSVPGGKLMYSPSILKYAKEVLEDAKYIKNDTVASVAKSGVLKSKNTIAKNLCEMAKNMLAIETVESLNIIFQAPSENATVEIGKNSEAKVSVYNYGSTLIHGKIKIFGADNSVLGESNISIKAGENTECRINVLVKDGQTFDSSLKVAIFQNGSEIATGFVPVMKQIGPVNVTKNSNDFVENTPIENVFTVDN